MTTLATMPTAPSHKKKSRPAGRKTPRSQRDGPRATIEDRHDLYQRSVQAVDTEIDFIDETFKELRGRHPRVIREDFCGTGNTSCEFVRRRPTNRAIGVDLDGETLEWGRANNIAKLKPAARKRVTLVQDDVLTVAIEPVDCVLAMNFSYYIFKERSAMRAYFERVREGLAPGGIFFLDAFGGYDAFREMTEPRDIEDADFTYVWDQAHYDPITGHATCKIHFRFPDGSRMKDAFVYHWRLWTLPEIREILAEAGFGRVTVYWEGIDDETGEGDGDFQPAEHGDADAGWICYLTAEV